jgi:spore maturation protein SpmA/spore maturation protein SpmB
MNAVFPALALLAFAVAALHELAGGAGAMAALSAAIVEQAGAAVTLALGLVGIMALFLGLMKVAEAGGLLAALARRLDPLFARLFPEIPAGHPAMGAMVMNVSANLLGLGNAATPFGLKAMEHLDRLNPRPGTASNAMVLFLALNTAGFTLIPTKVVALRAAAGSADPAAVVAPTLIATLVSSLVACLAARGLQRLWQPEPPAVPPPEPEPPPAARRGGVWAVLAPLGVVVGLGVAFTLSGPAIGAWLVPLTVAGVLAFGVARRVKVYECFVLGARDGLRVAVRIIPYLVAILVLVGMLRSSGALDLVLGPLGRLTAPLGVPAEALMMAGMRTLSGSGSFGLLAAQMKDPAIGPDSPLGLLLGTIYGSTETTFYVLAVYFGAVGVRRVRHALAVGLLADMAALLTAAAVCPLFSGRLPPG